MEILYLYVEYYGEKIRLKGIFNKEWMKNHIQKPTGICYLVPLNKYIERGVEL